MAILVSVLVFFALEQVYKIALYLYATEKVDVLVLGEDVLESAFKYKKKKTDLKRDKKIFVVDK